MPQSHDPLQYRGGAILRTFTIYARYCGKWSTDELAAQQNYLVGLAGYLSGSNSPADQQPMISAARFQDCRLQHGHGGEAIGG